MTKKYGKHGAQERMQAYLKIVDSGVDPSAITIAGHLSKQIHQESKNQLKVTIQECQKH